MKFTTLAAAVLLPLAALAQTAPLITVTDPEGDDHGDGSLVYPRDGRFLPGDLDLRSLRVIPEGADLRVEATFRNNIRDPSTVFSQGMGSESLSKFSRNGFFSFNLDIYIDTDRIPGSGNTVTLPGRRATLAPAYAWEKAIVLTPRPELMKREFISALRETSSANVADVTATVDRSVFFPTQVRVQGRTVSFVVPATFLSPAAVNGASVTAFVTQAQLTIDAGLNVVLGTPSTPRERFPLGAAQPDVGEPEFVMGYRGAAPPATSVVDLLSPDPAQQALQLASGGLLLGLNRENNMGAAPAPRTAAAPAAATATPAASSGSGSWFSNALSAVTGLFSSAPATPPAPVAAGTPQTVQSLMVPPPTAAAPATVAATVPGAAPGAAPAAATPQSVQTLMAPAGTAAVASPVAPTAPVVAAPPAAAVTAPAAAAVVAAPAAAPASFSARAGGGHHAAACRGAGADPPAGCRFLRRAGIPSAHPQTPARQRADQRRRIRAEAQRGARAAVRPAGARRPGSARSTAPVARQPAAVACGRGSRVSEFAQGAANTRTVCAGRLTTASPLALATRSAPLAG
jgi:C-terminal binding-module, SLH-like, of glucodextranase